MPNKSFREERLKQIFDIVRVNERVSVPELAEQFNMSESSIRLDLTELEKTNLITRTHGGAILRSDLSQDLIVNLDVVNKRIVRYQKEKEAIGKKTASLVEDGDTIMIDGGSTTKSVAKYLVNKKNLTIITNSLILIPEILVNPGINFYVLGGLTNRKHGITIGYLTDYCVEQFHPNKAILGIDGISLNEGLTAANPSNPGISSVKIKMIEVSEKIIIVSDSSKFNRVCLLPVAPIEAIDYLVTDSKAPKDLVKDIRDIGPQVLIANDIED